MASLTLTIKANNPFETDSKTKALTQLAQLDTDILDKLAELSKSPEAIKQLKTNFRMIKGFLTN